jgi:hypothetical protein
MCRKERSHGLFFLGQVRKMILRMEQQTSILNLRNYPAEVVDQLGKLLVEGASAREDPRRKNFYDVEHADRTFFIHVSPSSGRVMLLATWERLLRAGFASFEDRSYVTRVPAWNLGSGYFFRPL